MNIDINSTSSAPAAAIAFDAAACTYEIREITPENSLVGQFMQLHHQVLHALPRHGRHWVKRRHFASIKQHILNGHIGLGVFDAAGDMVGQALLTFPDLPGGQNLKGYPIGSLPGQFRPEHCMVVQTLGVSAKHEKQGIGKMLLQKAEEIAHQKFRRHLLAKTDITNKNSLASFVKMGYTAGPETTVEGEEYKCVFVYKRLPVAGKAHRAAHTLR